jgi:glycosyltransferase involved in cell wall biosynthesis
MKIGFYTPYLTDVVGGGERHFLTTAECLSKYHQVDIIVNKLETDLVSKFDQVFNLNLSKVRFIQGPFSHSDSALDRIKFTKDYDIFYFMTDGSFFISKAKKNIVHFQIPFNTKPSISQRLKLKNWQVKTSNSCFTKNHLENLWGITIDHIHRSAIDTKNLKPGDKKNIILSVGRFISPLNNKHCKKQDVLVRTFIKMIKQGLKGWKLVLIGPIDKGQDNLAYANKVQKLIKDYPIEIKHQLTFDQLKGYYAKAKIYWHAAGFGIDQLNNPQAVEHLGLTTIEAQSAGAVPVVINKGGQPEVVTDKLNGLLWNTQTELITQTLGLINNPPLMSKLSKRAIKSSKAFSKKKFCILTNQIFTL